MSRKVTFRTSAERDLDAIFDFIARDSPRNAIEFTRRIRDLCLSLGEFPERGTRRDDLSSGLRTIGFKRRVLIAYRVFPNRIQVVHIYYGGRDIERLLKRERRS